MMCFNRPTLISITAPTCAGKSYLLESLTSNLGFTRIVSTTTRAPREGEKQGVDYDYITEEHSKVLEELGEFAECVEYNGVRYGVTKLEMKIKVREGAPPPVIILNPAGVHEYQKFCGENGLDMFTIFVDTPEIVRMNRLVERTCRDIGTVCVNRVSTENKKNSPNLSLNFFREFIEPLIATNNNRLISIIREEHHWRQEFPWNKVVNGNAPVKDIVKEIAFTIKNLGE